ncbi:MAG: ATP-dependent DNA ligase [Candidatus Micrarchaeota archaeon]|nr:ATP-dependent DNA ligase [Candidatus Micrarchaeota archaeon]
MRFSELARVFRKMEDTSSRLALTDELAKVFKESEPGEMRKLVYLCQGIVKPAHEGIELGMAGKLAMRSISISSGKKQEDIEKIYRKEGDLGLAAEIAMGKRTQGVLVRQEPSVEKVYGNFYKIATAGGSGSQDLKVKLLSELLGSCEAEEARILVRFVTGSLRMGVGDATIIDALSYWAAGDKRFHDDIARAYNMRGDLGLVAELLFSKGIEAVKRISPEPFDPIRPALAERLPSAKEIFERLGKCAVEGKYDGFRIQVHVKGGRIEIYSRRQEKITHMFPDIVAAVKKQVKAKEIIFEGEAIAYSDETGTFQPFQVTIQRKRKHEVEEKAAELPLKLFAFELLFIDGKDYTQKPYRERVEKLRQTIAAGDTIDLAHRITASTPEEINAFFDESVSSGLEGIIAKDLEAPYVAGARKFAWIKLKKSYKGELTDTLDVAIVGYYRGKGNRTEFGLGGILTAAYDDSKNVFKTIAKIGTGFSEEQMAQFKKTLDEIKSKDRPAQVDSVLEPDVWVKPKYVVTVNADEITRSPTHTCGIGKIKGHENEGLALRFPRLVGDIRTDKSAEDATTEKEVLEMFSMQKQKATEPSGQA